MGRASDAPTLPAQASGQRRFTHMCMQAWASARTIATAPSSLRVLPTRAPTFALVPIGTTWIRGCALQTTQTTKRLLRGSPGATCLGCVPLSRENHVQSPPPHSMRTQATHIAIRHVATRSSHAVAAPSTATLLAATATRLIRKGGDARDMPMQAGLSCSVCLWLCGLGQYHQDKAILRRWGGPRGVCDGPF